ncbi:phage major capsid protein [Methylocystis sp. ATCC 49242]|uniref:phage major capsid protein n=1 Tax=Methylocystis sp. ATCC 49242 TaxID=622637 RepID=UPI0001F88850|nr:phage major capsid protein [Methylocystis sp. ATCC 49242]
MHRLPDLMEKRTGLVAEMSGLVAKDLAGTLGDEERARFETIDSDVKALDAKIDRARKVEAYERIADASPVTGGPGARDLRGYSVSRALRGSLGGRLDGLEGEMHAELSKGRETRGIMIPVSVLLGDRRAAETRALTTGGSAGALKGTDLMSEAFIDRLRPVMAVERLGATVLGGLAGNVDIPRLTGSATASWVAEDGASSRSDQTFDKVSLSPKTVAAETQFSRRLMLQSNPAIEGVVRNDLSTILATALDAAAIKGGGANEPVGVLATAGLQTVALGTNGAAPTPDNMADLIALPRISNVSSPAAFLTNEKVRKVAMKAKDTTSAYYGIPQFFQNEPVAFSNSVPSNLTKGTGTNLSAVIYGAWSDLFIAYWSAVDVLVNPYHQDVASKGGVLVHAFLDADIAPRHPESFAAIVDAIA